MSQKKFELAKSSTLKILYKVPGGWTWSWGHITFDTVSESVKVELMSAGVDPKVNWTLRPLLDSMVEFARDRFHDEKSGRLFYDLLQEELRKKKSGSP